MDDPMRIIAPSGTSRFAGTAAVLPVGDVVLIATGCWFPPIWLLTAVALLAKPDDPVRRGVVSLAIPTWLEGPPEPRSGIGRSGVSVAPAVVDVVEVLVTPDCPEPPAAEAAAPPIVPTGP